MKFTNKGISLMVLVITIIVMIILAGSIILTVSNNRIVDNSKIATIKSDLSNLKEKVALTAVERAKEDLDILKRYKLSEWGIESSEYENRVIIENGKLFVKRVEEPDVIEKAAEELGLLTRIGNNQLSGATGANLINYRIYGNSVCKTESNIDNPTDIQSLGEETRNLIDENNITVSSGYWYDSAGNPSDDDARFIRVSPIVVEPNTKYKITSNLDVYTVWEYNNVGTSIIRRYESNEFTTSENCSRLRISLYNTSGIADTAAFKWIKLQKVDDSKKNNYIDLVISGKNLFGGKYGEYQEINLIKGESYTASFDTKSSKNIQLALYDNSKNKIQTINFENNSGRMVATFIPSQNIKYVMFTSNSTNANLVKPQIEKGNVSTAYEVYANPVTSNISLKEPLRKIDNVVDYIDFKNQKIVRNVREVTFNGKEDWKEATTQLPDTYTVYVRLSDMKRVSNTFLFMANNFYGLSAVDNYTKTDKELVCSNIVDDNIIAFRINKTRASSIEEFKTWLAKNNITVLYPLATPIEESITVPDISTFKGTTYISVKGPTDVEASNIEVEY